MSILPSVFRHLAAHMSILPSVFKHLTAHMSILLSVFDHAPILPHFYRDAERFLVSISMRFVA